MAKNLFYAPSFQQKRVPIGYSKSNVAQILQYTEEQIVFKIEKSNGQNSQDGLEIIENF